MSERLLAVSQIIGGIHNVCICSKDHRRQAFTTSVIGVVDAVCTLMDTNASTCDILLPAAS